MEQIKRRFLADASIYGNYDEIATPSGKRIRGYYILTESGAVTPSHNPLDGFRKSDGFPMDANGQSVNDRDYERDLDAQQITRNIASEYDSRALQSPVIVSKDGVVLSGNGRTMAGLLAARDNTDGAYIGYLRQFSGKYGISADDVSRFRHPRLVFKASDDFPYTAETFAMFNAQDIKSQSKTEQAVKLGKLVDDATFARIIRNINTFDTVGEFYNNVKAATEAITDLAKAGVISQMSMPEMFDGDTISPQAREILENVLIGKAFQSNPDAVRQITTYKSMRKNIITALAEISNNIALTDYSLERETADAIDLVYNAKSSGYTIADYTRQTSLFDSGTKADVTDTTVIMLAEMINHEQVTRLKRLFVVYNSHARDAANGQVDMFSGGVKSKDEILDEVKAILNYSTKKLNDHLQNVTEQRKHEARTSIFMEEAERKDSQAVCQSDVEVGSYCRMKLPNGDGMIVKYEHRMGNKAGVRLKGMKRVVVPLSLLTPTDLTTLSRLPDHISDYNELVTWLAKKDDVRLVA